MVDAGAFDAVRLKTEGIDEIEIPIPRDLDDLPEEITIEEWEKMLVTGKKLMRLIYLPYYDDEDEDEEDEEDEQID